MPDTMKPKTDSKPDSTTNPGMPNVDNWKKNDEEAHKRMEHVADKAAHKAAKREQEFDKQHTEISK